MDEATFVLLVYSHETGTTLDEFDSFEEAFRAAEEIVTTSDWSFDEAVIDILTIKGAGFTSVLKGRDLGKLVRLHKREVQQREEAI